VKVATRPCRYTLVEQLDGAVSMFSRSQLLDPFLLSPRHPVGLVPVFPASTQSITSSDMKAGNTARSRCNAARTKASDRAKTALSLVGAGLCVELASTEALLAAKTRIDNQSARLIANLPALIRSFPRPGEARDAGIMKIIALGKQHPAAEQIGVGRTGENKRHRTPFAGP
jgi:hypothetical protein